MLLCTIFIQDSILFQTVANILCCSQIGQFYRSGVEIDEDKRILVFPNKNPIPVKQHRVWGFMKQEVADGELCWAAMNLGEQGEGIIDGTYLDYRVKDLLFSDFNKLKPKKHPN